ncbi:MAG: hypothetical protein ACYTBR_16000, partial [Planctomycetota bacterium]
IRHQTTNHEPERPVCRGLLTWGPFMGVPVLTGAVLLVLATQPHATVQQAVRDEGIVQQVSAWLMLLAVVPVLWRFRFGWSLVRFETAIIIVAVALREWDWHRRFTAESVTSINYFQEPVDPLSVRILAAVILSGLIAAGVHCVVSWWPRFVSDLKALRPWAVNAVLWAGTMIAAASLDKLVSSRSYGNTIEEAMELSAGALLIYVAGLMPSEPQTASPAAPGEPAPGPPGS